MKTISYTSPNGYTGILYGERSYSVKDPNGREVMHTGFRNFNTEEELKEHVDNYPKLMELLRTGRIEKDENDDI